MRFVACSLILAVASTARADDNAVRASKLFEEGRALSKAGKLTEACGKFEESFKLDAQTGTQVNLADCFEKTGKLRAAWIQFDAAAIESLRAGNSVRAKFARDRADALDAKLAQVVLHVENPALAGLHITINDHDVTPAAQITDRVEPGDVAVTASAAGHKDLRLTSHAAAGGRVDLPVTLDVAFGVETPSSNPDSSPITLGLPPPPPNCDPQETPNCLAQPRTADKPLGVAAPPPTYDMQRDRGRVHVAWALGGASIATGLTGLGIAFYAKHAYDDAVSKNDITTANHEVHVSDVGTGFAVASIACGAAAAIVYFTAPRERIVVTPSASSTSASLTVLGRF